VSCFLQDGRKDEIAGCYNEGGACEKIIMQKRINPLVSGAHWRARAGLLNYTLRRINLRYLYDTSMVFEDKVYQVQQGAGGEKKYEGKGRTKIAAMRDYLAHFGALRNIFKSLASINFSKLE
jgi:hypothetical protein